MYRTITSVFLLGVSFWTPVATRAEVIINSNGGDQPHSNVQPSLAINHIIALQGTFPSRNKDDKGLEPYLGEVDLFAGNFAPRGWAFCDGQILPIDQNQSLYALLGTTYGGDGRTTFALPDLRGRVAVHPGTGDGLSSRQLGQKFGVDDVTLTVNQLPAHGHNIEHPWLGNLATEGAGGNQSHTIVQPSLGLNHTITTQGIYPSRDKGLDSFIAEIDLFAGNFAPRSSLFPDGQLLPVADNEALFSLIGTTYGGDGRTNVALPDLRGRAVMHAGDGPGLTPRRLGEETGVEEATLTATQLASHNHFWDDTEDIFAFGYTTSTGGSQPYNNVQPSLALNYMIALQGVYPSRDKQSKSADPFVGEVGLFAGTFAPRGWALCEGQLLQIGDNNALFSLLGTIYGGDGRTTFGLPDLRGRVAVHPGQGPGLQPWVLGQKRGAEMAAIGLDQMASHSHGVVVPEPSTFVLAMLGLLTLGLAAWRRQG